MEDLGLELLAWCQGIRSPLPSAQNLNLSRLARENPTMSFAFQPGDDLGNLPRIALAFDS
jgi:hypothetical protein